jgi:hypothetical protein
MLQEFMVFLIRKTNKKTQKWQMFNLTSDYLGQVVLDMSILTGSFWLTIQNLGINFFGN